MGWSDLFRSKSSKLKADDRLRWFGKLSTYADYYTSKADEEWAVEFNDWVLKGYEQYMSRQKTAGRHVEQLAMSRLALRLPKSGMTVLASLQDYGGDMRGRPFPLCFYVGIPTANWPGPASGRAGGALGVLRDLENLEHEVTRFFSAPGRFDTVFADRQMPLNGMESAEDDTAWTKPAGDIALADWYAGVRDGLPAASSEAWFAAVKKWGDAVSQMCAGDDAEATLRFPIASGIDPDVQAVGWLRWLESRMDLSKRFVSVLLCDAEPGRPGRLTIVAREPMMDDFLLLTPLADTLNYVDDACRLAAPKEGEDAVAHGTSPPAGSWLDFVESR